VTFKGGYKEGNFNNIDTVRNACSWCVYTPVCWVKPRWMWLNYTKVVKEKTFLECGWETD